MTSVLPEQTSGAPQETRRRGLNLVALARPYFGLIVLTTGLLAALGVVAMLRMPSGIYPEVAFPRIVVIAQTPGLAVKDVEVAVTRPIEEAVSIVLGVTRVRSKSVRGAAQLSIDFAPGTDMIQALNDVRARMAEVGSQLAAGHQHDRRAANPLGLSDHLVRGDRRSRPVGAARLCLLRSAAADQPHPDVSYVTVQGGDIREILVEVDPETLVAAGPVDRRRGRSLGQRTPAQSGRPDRPRFAAISGAGRQPGRRPADRSGIPGHFEKNGQPLPTVATWAA